LSKKTEKLRVQDHEIQKNENSKMWVPGFTLSHLSTHLAWNSWAQGRTFTICRTSKSHIQMTQEVCSLSWLSPDLQERTLLEKTNLLVNFFYMNEINREKRRKS